MKKTESKNPRRKSVKPIPKGFHTVTPFLTVNGAAGLIDFIENAFDGQVTSIMKGDDNTVMHATVKIGDSNLMISDANEKFPAMPSMLYLYVKDVDSVYRKAIDGRGTSLRKPTDEFYGDRSAGIKDDWDNQWWIATHIEDVSDEEMEKRKEKFSAQEVPQ
jgi:PhnB protein